MSNVAGPRQYRSNLNARRPHIINSNQIRQPIAAPETCTLELQQVNKSPVRPSQQSKPNADAHEDVAWRQRLHKPNITSEFRPAEVASLAKGSFEQNFARDYDKLRYSKAKAMGDWRLPRGPEQLDRPTYPCTESGMPRYINMIHQGKKRNLKQHSSRDTKWTVTMKHEDCKPGAIIKAVIHEVDYMEGYEEGTVTPDPKHTVQTNCGLVYSKERWQIVISAQEEHYITVPVYTFEGNGLAKKRDHVSQYFLAIQDQRVPWISTLR